MTCLQYKTLIDDYADDELSPELRNEFETHLNSCDFCKKELNETKHLKELLKSNSSNYPGNLYFEETAELIFARTIEKDNWQRTHQEKSPAKVQSEFYRALFSAAAALIIFAISIVIGTSDEKFAQNNLESSPVFVMVPIEKLLQPNNSPIFTKAEQLNHIQGMLLISPPGMLGRLSVIHEYNRLAN